jgi:thioredoxin-related protein
MRSIIKTGHILPALMLGVFAIAAKSPKSQRVKSTAVTEVTAPADTTVKSSKASISWLDFESGYAKAVKENKMILVDVYTNWCGWCKVMDRETYSNDSVIKKVNTHFVTVKLNPEINRNYTFDEKTMTSEELHRWLGYGNTYGYPTTYFMVAPGKKEDRYPLEGYLDATEFNKILDIVISKRGN